MASPRLCNTGSYSLTGRQKRRPPPLPIFLVRVLHRTSIEVQKTCLPKKCCRFRLSGVARHKVALCSVPDMFVLNYLPSRCCTAVPKPIVRNIAKWETLKIYTVVDPYLIYFFPQFFCLHLMARGKPMTMAVHGGYMFVSCRRVV